LQQDFYALRPEEPAQELRNVVLWTWQELLDSTLFLILLLKATLDGLVAGTAQKWAKVFSFIQSKVVATLTRIFKRNSRELVPGGTVNTMYIIQQLRHAFITKLLNLDQEAFLQLGLEIGKVMAKALKNG